MASSGHLLEVKKFEASKSLKTLTAALLFVGVLAAVVGLILNKERLWASYLVSYFFFTSLALGGLFFAAINYIANAGWSVSVRRIAEATTAFLPVTFVGGLVLLIGGKHLFPWLQPEELANPVVQAKTAYLNLPFFLVRLVVFAGGMWLFARAIVGNSLSQDTGGGDELTYKNQKLSVIWILFFALSFSAFSVDLLMSLLPTWYSTIFGIYCFAGMAQSFFAFFIISLILLKRSSFVKGYYSEEHIHDCAKFLKGFTVFWAYIAFSQFMLIWYANIPEETEYYLLRSQGGWTLISVALLVFKFVIPFLALLPRWAKRSENHLLLVCSLILVMQWVDVFWMVFPNFNSHELVFGGYEIGLFALFAGLFLLSLQKFYGAHSLVAVKDPRMHEALNHHVTY